MVENGIRIESIDAQKKEIEQSTKALVARATRAFVLCSISFFCASIDSILIPFSTIFLSLLFLRVS